MSAIANPQIQHKTRMPLFLIVTGLLTLGGVAAWIVQLQRGMISTALTDLSTWGLYIALFIFFMGLSAGSLVLAALPIIFPMPRFRPYAKLAAFVALISLVIAGLFILVDIGRPERLWRIVRFGQLSSPMVWDMLLTVAYFIIATLFLRRLMTAKSDNDVKVIAWVALLAGIADGLTAFVFATQVGREYWFSAVQPIAFFTAALASAGAVLLLLLVILKRAGYHVSSSNDLAPLAWLTASAVALGLLLQASELVTHAFTRSASAMVLVNNTLASPLFWIEVVAGALALLVLILPVTRRSPLGLATGSILAIVHLAAKRMEFVRIGFAVPNISYAGVEIAPAVAYVPGLVEWAVGIGLLAMFGFLLGIGLYTLHLLPEEK